MNIDIATYLHGLSEIKLLVINHLVSTQNVLISELSSVSEVSALPFQHPVTPWDSTSGWRGKNENFYSGQTTFGQTTLYPSEQCRKRVTGQIQLQTTNATVTVWTTKLNNLKNKI